MLRYAWALPTTLLGLACALAARWSGGGLCRVEGVLEVHGGLVSRLLECCPLPGGASALTLGHVVLGRDPETLEASRPHERVHVAQAERWGPLFIPAYLGASLLAHLNGGHFYRDNAFEREACGTSRKAER